MATVIHIIDQNLPIYATGDQNISGVKNFYSRPTVNGTGVLLSGEASSATLPTTIVYTTGNQTISGVKTFASRPTVNGTGVLLIGEASSVTLPNIIVYTTGSQIISGNKTFASRPTVNGTGVLLSGEAANVTLPATIVYTTGNQTISGIKTFAENTVFGDSTQDNIFVVSGNQVSFGVRPTVNGTGVLLIGEASSVVLPDTIVYMTGNQTINGTKTFDVAPIVSGNRLITGLDLNFYASITNLFNTGSRLDNKINSLSGYVNSQNTVFSGQTFNTGSRLDNKINSLSGYVGSQDIIFSGQIASTGSILNNKINALSGYVSGISLGGLLPNTIVYNTGNQTISGIKTFASRPTVNGTGVLLSGEGIASLITIQDEGSSQGSASTLNFIGGGVSVSVGGSTAAITINGGGGTSLVSPPVSPNAFGISGQIALDQNYSYYCISDNNWRRSAIGSW